MAITCYGYPGQLDQVQYGKISRFWGSEYNVGGRDDLRVTRTSGDRRVSIAAGSGYHHGVLVESDTAVAVSLDAVASGSRWDMIVLRRNWAGAGSATFAVVKGTSSKKLPSRSGTPGVSTDDQPLALVRVQSGLASPQEVIDLRVFTRRGGAVAVDALVLDYFQGAGTTVRIGTTTYRNIVRADGGSGWQAESDLVRPITGSGQGLAVSGNPAGALEPILRGGTFRTRASGWQRELFPTAFPNGLISVGLFNGDGNLASDLTFDIDDVASDRQRFRWRALGPKAGGGREVLMNNDIRINWIALGW